MNKHVLTELLIRKAKNVTIGMVVLALMGIPLIHNILVTVIINVLTMSTDFLLGKYFYKRNLKRFEEELNKNLKTMNEILDANDPYIESVTIIDETDSASYKYNLSDSDFELQEISPNLKDGQTIIMQLIGEHKEDLDNELVHIWKKSGEEGLKLIKVKDINKDEEEE